MNLLKWFARLVFGVAGIAACWGAWYVVYLDSMAKSAAVDKPAAKEALTVEIVPVREQRLQERITLVGSLIPIAQSDVRPRTAGYIVSLKFDIGDFVQSGENLCQLDDLSSKETVARAEAILGVARRQLDARQVELTGANDALRRQELLMTRGAGTSEQLESARVAKGIAEANVQLEEARVAQAQVELAQVKLQMEELKLAAPLSGHVAERLMDVGDLAQPNLPLMKIVNIDTVQTTVQVVERDYSKIRPGQRAEVRVDSYPGQIFEGKVSRIAPILNPETRTASILIDVPNAERLLKPGMFARVSLAVDQERLSLTVPVSALLDDGGAPYVMVVDPETQQVLQRKLEMGISDKVLVEVRSGIQATDQVITLGNRLVRPGQLVKAVEVPWPETQFAGSETAAVTRESTPAE